MTKTRLSKVSRDASVSAPTASGSSISPSPKKAKTFLPVSSISPRFIIYRIKRAWYMAIIGPSPMETVANCQKFGMRYGCGYDERPPALERSLLKLCRLSLFSLPSRYARAYIPGEACP